MGFTSKLQGRKILTCCKFKLNLYFTEVIKFYWLMLLLYPGELYRILGASSSNFLLTNLFSKFFLYFFIISSLFLYFNLFVSIFIQSYVNIKLHVSTWIISIYIGSTHGMSVRYSTPHVHYLQLNPSRVCLPTNFQKFKCHIFICVCVCVSIYEL
jgi:hypothetical protein